MTVSVPGWRYVHHGFEGSEVSVGGVNLWQYEWQLRDDTIEVPHPSYPCRSGTGSKSGELTAGTDR